LNIAKNGHFSLQKKVPTPPIRETEKQASNPLRFCIFSGRPQAPSPQVRNLLSSAPDNDNGTPTGRTVALRSNLPIRRYRRAGKAVQYKPET
jgi:hypothetical protein